MYLAFSRFVSSVDYRGEPEYPAAKDNQKKNENKLIVPYQPTKPVLNFREITLPNLVPNNVKQNTFKYGNSLKPENQTPVYRPTPKKKPRVRVIPERKEVHLPTFYRPERNKFKPINKHNSLEEPETSETSNPTNILGRSAMIQAKENVLESKEEDANKAIDEEDSESRIKESKMFEIMKEIKTT